MEECEALCTKLGIMVNGQFECLGNIQNLKSKYGQGYTLVIKCKLSVNSENPLVELEGIIQRMESFVQTHIPNSVLKDKQEQTLFYQIYLNEASDVNNNMNFLSLAQIFTLIESNKDNLSIETYSLSQTTLEQIFIAFARKQNQTQ